MHSQRREGTADISLNYSAFYIIVYCSSLQVYRMPGIFSQYEQYTGEKKKKKSVFGALAADPTSQLYEKKKHCLHLPGGSSKVCQIPSYRMPVAAVYTTKLYRQYHTCHNTLTFMDYSSNPVCLSRAYSNVTRLENKMRQNGDVKSMFIEPTLYKMCVVTLEKAARGHRKVYDIRHDSE